MYMYKLKGFIYIPEHQIFIDYVKITVSRIGQFLANDPINTK